MKLIHYSLKTKLKQYIESGNTLKIPPTEVSVQIQDVNKCLLDEK